MMKANQVTNESLTWLAADESMTLRLMRGKPIALFRRS